VFWEIMGLMSYLLIGHFAHDPSKPFFFEWARWASKKAFLTTRVGDVSLLIGMMMFYREFDTLQLTELWARARETVAANGGEFPGWMTVAGLFVFGGTVGKSAQFPLHVWLPDAMAGPTPVSAMIHAATMVAAGVFLLGRTYPLMSPEALSVITFIGATTAIFAATIGMTAYDLKAVLAYSTISQLGFMVTAVGLGGVVAGMFHMVTHAFFKACLFLSAGSVIHGCHHEQDMRRMGGLRRTMPVTFVCMTVCTLAISGAPFFAGFYSKDQILLAGWANLLEAEHFSGWALYALLALALAAAMTAFYMFRLVFMSLFGSASTAERSSTTCTPRPWRPRRRRAWSGRRSMPRSTGPRSTAPRSTGTRTSPRTAATRTPRATGTRTSRTSRRPRS
jgi:NADH-quinone oxidoreductase subunit L